MRFPLILKKFIVLSVLTVVCACGQPPMSHSEDTQLKEPVTAAIPPAAKAEPALSKTQMIADFEGDPNDLTNQLGGGSGEWNLNPDDVNDSYTDPLIVKMPGKDGKESQVLSLGYSTEAASESTQNGFWTKLRGFDASDYDHLEFEVKGDAQKGFTEILKIEIKKPKPKTEAASGDAYAAHSTQAEVIKGTARVKVTADWQTASIPLNAMTGLINFIDPEAWKNPSISRRDLDELVFVFHKRMVTKQTGKIYLDNIRFVKTGNPGPTAVDFPPRKHEKTATKIEGFEFQKFLRTRLMGFPEKTVVKKQFPAEREAFFREVAKDTWKFFENIVDKENGLPLDTIQIAPKGDQAFVDGAWIGDYTNVTNIGVYLMCVVSAYDLKFITKEQAVQKLQTTLNTLEHKLEYHSSGFPYNYYDTTTAERTNYLVSLVDSGWYLAGLYVIKNAFPQEVGEQAGRLISRGHLSFFYDPVERLMFHGYYDHLHVYSDYNYGVFYSEPRAASYMAIARGDVPKEHWFGGLFRTFPDSFDWQGQKPKEQVEKTALGLPYKGGYYEWKDLKYVPSWGGSAFEALMPTLILKEKDLAPKGLGGNDAAQVQGQIRYATEELGYPVWGMSPSSVPEGGYSEYGAHPFGSKGYKPGVVTPHASALSVEFAPEAVEKNLRKLIELYDIYGEYGFYDAVTVQTGLVARKYLALDQGMILVALNNYINHGAIRERFHSDPDMKKGEELLTAENLLSKENFKP